MSTARQVKVACPLDCFDACGLVATVVGGRVVKLTGDRDHPLTRGRICIKGKRLLTRLYHPQRLTRPLRKRNGRFVPITWEDALAEMAEQLETVRRAYDSRSVLHFSYAGHGGVKKMIDQVFFNCFGGATVSRGSLCCGAGIAAQVYDFGAARGHDPEDAPNARTILLWGRNPAVTSPHLLPILQRARRGGTQVVLIDPLKTASARLCDRHVAPRPATDGALALGMAHVIVADRLLDEPYVRAHVHGFDAFTATLGAFAPERAAALTGVPADDIVSLARTYAAAKPAAIIVGYGLQRYGNGGATVRCIDALGALTGNIGIPGGGVNYANRGIADFIGGDLAASDQRVTRRRTFSIARLAAFLESADAPPVRFMLVSKANPLVQVPNLQRTLQAFERVPFKVVIDHFMTDTARHADLVLPCTAIMEDEDLIFTSMYSPYLNYSARAVDPPPGVRSEYDLFQELARRLNLDGFPLVPAEVFLERALQPLHAAYGLTLDQLREGCFKLPERDIPWQNGRFATPSGRYELFSARAQAAGHDPLPVFVAPPGGDPAHPLRLLTPHHRDSMHSQHFAFVDRRPTAHVHPRTVQRQGLAAGVPATVRSPLGSLRVTLHADERVAENVVMIYQGWWHQSGSVNVLTADRVSDMGEQAAYYDCFCRLEPA